MGRNGAFGMGIVACAAFGLAGCAPLELRQPVTVVRTSTPGVAYVLVQPVTQKDRDDPDPELENTDRNSDYILVCDARRGDGMRCSVAPEVSRSRFSEHRPIAKEGTSFNVGTSVDAGGGAQAPGGPKAAATPPGASAAQGGVR